MHAPPKRNWVAKALRQGIYQHKVVPSKKRKDPKHKPKIELHY